MSITVTTWTGEDEQNSYEYTTASQLTRKYRSVFGQFPTGSITFPHHFEGSYIIYCWISPRTLDTNPELIPIWVDQVVYTSSVFSKITTSNNSPSDFLKGHRLRPSRLRHTAGDRPPGLRWEHASWGLAVRPIGWSNLAAKRGGIVCCVSSSPWPKWGPKLQWHPLSVPRANGWVNLNGMPFLGFPMAEKDALEKVT